jgi:hypothetical protein
MKKTFTVIALLALTLGAFAQNTGKDRLDELENKTVEEKKSSSKKAEREYRLFDFQVLARVGGGGHIMDAPEFPKGYFKSTCSEFFFNTVELDICPTRWMSIDLGIDLKWQDFTTLSGNVFSKNAAGDVVFAATPAGNERQVSTLHYFSLAAPLMLDFNLGLVGVSLGAEVVYTPASRVSIQDSYTIGASDYKVTTHECGGVPRISWNAYASLNFGFYGIYFRYYPQQPLIPTAPFSVATVGVVFNSKGI